MKKSYAQLALMVAIWGLINIISSVLIKTISPFVQGFEHRVLIFVFFFIYFAFTKNLSKLKINRYILLLLSILAILNFICDGVYYIGIEKTSPENGALLYRMDLIFTTLLSVILLKEKIKWYQWLLLLVMVIGMFLAIFGDNLKGFKANWYNLLFVFCALTDTVFVFVLKWVNGKLEEKKIGLDNKVLSLYVLTLNAALFFVFALFNGKLHMINLIFTDANVLALCIIMALLQCVMSVIYFQQLKVHKLWFIKIITYFIPITTMVFSAVILKQVITLEKVAGMALIIGSAVTFILSKKNQQPVNCQKD